MEPQVCQYQTVSTEGFTPRTCAKLCHTSGGELEQIQFLLGHAYDLTAVGDAARNHVLLPSFDGNNARSQSSKVKSLSPNHPFVIALHSPDSVVKTGLHSCPSEKMTEKQAFAAKPDAFSSPVRSRESRNCGHLERFCGDCGQVSLQPRLHGGESGIQSQQIRKAP